MLKYSIDDLITIFGNHSTRAEIQREKDLEAHPNAEWLQDDFNLPEALLQMCRAIRNLEEKE